MPQLTARIMRLHISSFLRWTSTPGTQANRNLHISCRGKPIPEEKLYEYTNGGFLINEKSQFDRRYVKFSLDALCDVAATAGGQFSPVRAIEKMEGGFSKALLMKKENGMEIVAKIACRNAGPPVYTTEPEVAILKYVKGHTSVPVPEVYVWSSDPKNPVGAEYIIMGKATGVPLFKIWGEISLSDRLELVKGLTVFERELSSLQLPAYGSLYLRSFGGSLSSSKSLSVEIDPSQSYCVGRSGDRVYVLEGVEGPNVDLGPWDTLATLGAAIARREIARVLQGLPPHPGTFYQGSSEEKTGLLESVISLMKMLDSTSNPSLAQLWKPVVWHTDLHMGNIYVSPENPSQILSIIDWQSISFLPLFLQARWPIFLEPPENFVRGFQVPKLPANFREMDEEDKQLARYEYQQAMVAKAYEVSTYLENQAAHTAMTLPRVFRELFKRCGETSEVGILPLRACMIEIFHSWSELGFTGECPYTFSEDEIANHDTQFTDYEDWYKANEIARKCLDTDEEGWISPELDIEGKRRQNQELFEMFVEQMSAERPPEEARRMWPFVDNSNR
ncbi:serine/threonine protein kinase [Nannizzia gypsea CBS 118893]|uniref:Altered inheritance of mitochondria protein 9, mitochondrial n=1 Tax=Arthroderma gypseum (strain ATCC MYA-4604 / CBS 118893) TaxID=535722 RepID=E4V5Y0_ARTGP|nr:serine/threonine protein kinase [Nannizzia gypsea CBS 118893]EFR05505.1 serine/threonine protein kinase [Nannizzia gypsea CBS 118893]